MRRILFIILFIRPARHHYYTNNTFYVCTLMKNKIIIDITHFYAQVYTCVYFRLIIIYYIVFFVFFFYHFLHSPSVLLIYLPIVQHFKIDFLDFYRQIIKVLSRIRSDLCYYSYCSNNIYIHACVLIQWRTRNLSREVVIFKTQKLRSPL